MFVLGYAGAILFAAGLVGVVTAFVFFLFISTVVMGLGYGAPWVPTRQEAAQAMIESAHLTGGETILDIGCGTGTILFAALRQGRAKQVIGIDRNPMLIWICRWRAWISGNQHRAKFFCQDARTCLFPQTDVVFLYLLPPLMEQLRPRLKELLRPGTRIISNGFSFSGAKERGGGSFPLIHSYFSEDL